MHRWPLRQQLEILWLGCQEPASLPGAATSQTRGEGRSSLLTTLCSRGWGSADTPSTQARTEGLNEHGHVEKPEAGLLVNTDERASSLWGWGCDKVLRL